MGSLFGRPWFRAAESESEDHDCVVGDAPQFPDMTAIQNVAMGPRAGLIVGRL